MNAKFLFVPSVIAWSAQYIASSYFLRKWWTIPRFIQAKTFSGCRSRILLRHITSACYLHCVPPVYILLFVPRFIFFDFFVLSLIYPTCFPHSSEQYFFLFSSMSSYEIKFLHLGFSHFLK